MSTPPRVFRAASAIASAPVLVRTSAATKEAPSGTVLASDLAVASTSAPSSRSWRTTAAPIPRVPPVTRARFPANSFVVMRPFLSPENGRALARYAEERKNKEEITAGGIGDSYSHSLLAVACRRCSQRKDSPLGGQVDRAAGDGAAEGRPPGRRRGPVAGRAAGADRRAGAALGDQRGAAAGGRHRRVRVTRAARRWRERRAQDPASRARGVRPDPDPLGRRGTRVRAPVRLRPRPPRHAPGNARPIDGGSRPGGHHHDALPYTPRGVDRT